MAISLSLAASAEAPVDFDTEVVPVLTRVGCNAGSCHGSAAGRGNFRLSLFGADPAADYFAIVQQFEGRRVDLVTPSESLLLRKPTGQLEHGGDLVMFDDSPAAELLRRWIAEGATRSSTRRLENFTVTPETPHVNQVNSKFQLTATANFRNGDSLQLQPEDVTRWTVFTSTDVSSVELKFMPNGETQATVHRPGQHTVIARFLDRVVAVPIICPFDTAPSATSDTISATDGDGNAVNRSLNLIDRHVNNRLHQLQIPAASRAEQNTLVRRLSLDLTGRLPDHDTMRRLASGVLSLDAYVNELMASDAFVDYWTLQFSRWLQVHSLPNEPQAVETYTNWLHQCLSEHVRLDEMAAQLITATGDSHQVGPANFSRMVRDARGQAELVSKFFMGARLECANCHNHPLDRWTQDDYHGLAAVFARLDRGRTVTLTSRGGVTNLRTGEPAIPRIPGERYLDTSVDGRADLTRWLVESDSHPFARAMANRLWNTMFGRGLVHPVDDMRLTNPATHPELLGELADYLVTHHYDLRAILRLIVSSDTYCRSGQTVPANAQDHQFYSHAYARPLSAEVYLDAICDVTGVPTSFDGVPVGTRAVQLYDPLLPAESLNILGRCQRLDGCEPAVGQAGLPAKLHLLNGALINEKLVASSGRIQRLLREGATNEAIVTEFYEVAYARTPRKDEREVWIQALMVGDSEKRSERIEDFVWSILNSREFGTNH
jgi:hypothetical protein